MGCHIIMSAPAGQMKAREEVETIIARVDLSRYAALASYYYDVDAQEAERWIRLFKKSMSMFALHRGVYLWLHKEADRILHILLLHPREYVEFCDLVFGALLEHGLKLPDDPVIELEAVTIHRTRQIWEEMYPDLYDTQGQVEHTPEIVHGLVLA